MKNISIYITFLLVAIVTYWLTYIEKIGLHGDEAYFGIDGVDILNEGLRRPYGMNKYTGALQSISNSVLFRLFDINITFMRLSGIFCNLIALYLSVKLIYERINAYAVLLFLLCFAQSGLFLGYSKIAWEVCSFNFFFMTLTAFALHKLKNSKKSSLTMLQFLFLFATLIGSYNHILFSSFVGSIFLGVILSIFSDKTHAKKEMTDHFILICFSMVNIVLLYYFMTNMIDYMWEEYGNLVFILPLLLILLELVVLKKIGFSASHFIDRLSRKGVHSIIRLFVALVFIIPFVIIHLLSVFDILSNDIVLMRLFSFDLNTYLKFYFISLTGLLLIYCFYKLIYAFVKGEGNLMRNGLLAYLGIFCIYTQGHSIRYYIILILLLFLYLSYELSREIKLVRTFFTVILVPSVIFVQSILWSINIDDGRKVSAMKFKIGGDFKETSAHFLNFSPVIDFVHQNQIGALDTKERFFINYVFKFYKLSDPAIEDYHDTAIVNYDYSSTPRNGFKIDLKK